MCYFSSSIVLSYHYSQNNVVLENPKQKYVGFSKDLRETKIDWISNDLIKLAMQGFQAKKSPGPDGLKPIVFQYLPEKYIGYLDFIY